MDKYVFAFDDIDSMTIATCDIKKSYNHLYPVSDPEKLQITVYISEMCSDITFIRAIIEQAGGICIA